MYYNHSKFRPRCLVEPLAESHYQIFTPFQRYLKRNFNIVQNIFLIIYWTVSNINNQQSCLQKKIKIDIIVSTINAVFLYFNNTIKILLATTVEEMQWMYYMVCCWLLRVWANEKHYGIQINILTDTMIETILFSIASISDSFSLKHTSQTPTILCKSSSIPLDDFSSAISAPKLLKYFLSSKAYILIFRIYKKFWRDNIQWLM